MATYADVALGRLLLAERLVSLGQLHSVLPRLSPRLPEAQGLHAVLGGLGWLDPGSLETAGRRVQVVLRAERERALARLLHLASILPEERILEVFEVVRGTSFSVSLGSRLIERGLLDAARVEALYQLCEAALRGARHRRERELGGLALDPPAPGSSDAHGLVAQAFALCEQILDLGPYVEQARRTAEAGPQDPLHSAQMESSAALRVAPEDCPIYGYEILEELGRGAMGVVYKARHIFTDRLTALKVLPLKLAEKGEYIERFKREAMAVMRLQHENVVRAHDFGGSEDYYYLALEYVEGETLETVLEREGRLPERRALEIARQIALGLGCAHEQGVVHRDVKPENIMITVAGAAKLCDFGIVKLKDLDEGGLTMAGTTVGTPFYISPEQAKGEEDLDIRSDLYSLGITLYHLATGQVPFTAKSQGAILVRHILEEVPDPRNVLPELSEAFAGLVARLTRKKREERYATPGEVVAAVDAVLDRG